MLKNDTTEGGEKMKMVLRKEDIIDDGGGEHGGGEGIGGRPDTRPEGGPGGSEGGKQPFKITNWVWSVRSRRRIPRVVVESEVEFRVGW